MPENEFYSYAVDKENGDYEVIVYDLDLNGYEVVKTKSKKLAEYIMNIFDDLAIDEEQDLFNEIIE